MTRTEILAEASRIISEDRAQAYGDPVEVHKAIAEAFNAITGHAISADEVALMHICTKLVRLKTSPGKADHYVDIAGYSGIAAECNGAK